MFAVVICAGAMLAGATEVPAQQPADPTAALLVDLIKVNSSNPPGRTQGLADVLAPKFRALGFEVDVIPTPDSGKVHLIARLKGNGRKRPVLIAAHGDVVGVEREKWSVDPFAGVVQDGYVLGRGALDFKGGIAVFARAAMMLAERKVKLDRDVIFLMEADEEGALPYNTEWLAKGWWPKIDAEFALNEGGWIIARPDGSVRYVSISTADKGTYGVLVSARGTSTHSSMPVPDNAIAAVARAVARLSTYEWPVDLTPSTRRFFQVLGKTSSGADARAFDDVVSGDSLRIARGDAVISADPLLHALLRTTWTPTIFNAGFRVNVIPGSAEAMVNVRTIPGTTPEMVLARMRQVIADTAIALTMAWNPGTPIPESSDTTALFRALAAAARATYSGAEVTPYLFQAGTDAAAWRSRGVPVYGIYPYAISAEDLKRMHGNDERISVDALRTGTDFMYRTLVNVAATK
jgi:acetylornithine deacetylase/succinyl-diaminopimelate desuccinylase-like protein